MEGDVERLRDNFSKIKDITRIWRLFFIVLDLKNLLGLDKTNVTIVSSTRCSAPSA